MPVFVNKCEITDDEVHAEMIHHPAPDLESARLEAARALVVRRLLLEAAAGRGMIAARDIDTLGEAEVEAVIADLLDAVITTPDADEATCRRFYAQHQQRFTDQKTEKPIPYELVKAHIVQYLEDKAYYAAFNAYLDTLMAQSEIVGLAA